jgi:hypothetical protein
LTNCVTVADRAFRRREGEGRCARAGSAGGVNPHELSVLFGSPDAGQLFISQATGPAFILGAVAGFVSILLGRINAVMDRIRHLNDISDDERVRLHLKSDIPRLQRRLGLLSSAVLLALASGVCTSLPLVVSFASAFLRLQHVFGAAVLFFLAVALLGVSLFKFGQEVRIGISEADHYR